MRSFACSWEVGVVGERSGLRGGGLCCMTILAAYANLTATAKRNVSVGLAVLG